MLTDDEVKKASNIRLIINICIVLSILGAVFAVTGFVRTGLQDAASTVTYSQVADKAVDSTTHTVDFEYLHEVGCVTSSWIYIPDTNVDYPLVQGADNDYYMYKDAYGNENSAGAIFINFANSSNLTDPKTVIFGHNMLDGSMFTDLHKYAKESYGKEHEDMYIYMENGETKHYRVLCYLYTDPSNEAVYVVSKAEVVSNVAKVLTGQADVVYNDYSGGLLVCLSTCKYHDNRSVVVFEEIDGDKPSDGYTPNSSADSSLYSSSDTSAAGDATDSAALDDSDSADSGGSSDSSLYDSN